MGQSSGKKRTKRSAGSPPAAPPPAAAGKRTAKPKSGRQRAESPAAGGALTQAAGGAFMLTTLEQVKVLSHPLRVKILESLLIEHTTKQVADLLGEKPTRLYHHVAALEKIGLVRLTRRRRKRGTVENYYRSVAGAFQADPRLFETPAARRAGESVIEGFLSQASGEIAALMRCAGDETKDGIKEEGLLSFLEVRASEREIRALSRKLAGIISGLTREDGRDSGPSLRRFRLLIAFYPLDADRKR